MNNIKDEIIQDIIKVEGGYVNDPNDSGGETNFGITKRVAEKYGYTGPMRDMPVNLAYDIYVDMYWSSIHGDVMLEISERITKEVVDTAVNMGVYRASIFLQQTLNAFNSLGSIYDDIKEDGHIGQATITALSVYCQNRDDEVLTKALNVLQGAFYLTLARKREKDERFIYGWFKNRVKL